MKAALLHRCVSGVVALVTCVAVARAADPLDYLTITPIGDGIAVETGRANTDINTVPFKRQSLTTVDDYQFTSYYDPTGKLRIARRNLAASPATWSILQTQFISYNINDAHNTSSIAIDGDGYLHVSWGMHGGGPLLYTRSTASVLSDDPFHLVGETQGNSGRIANAIPLQEQSNITYPEFYNIPGGGDLLFTYRTGGSGNGDYHLARWFDQQDQWLAIHASTTDPWISRDNFSDGLPNVNAYPNQMVFDSRGVLHATWTWRTGGDTTTGHAGVQTNHHILYAQSFDFGWTWRNSDWSVYKRPGDTHVIDEANAEIVVNLPEGSSLINTTGMAVGPDDTVYLASWWAPGTPQADYRRQYMLAWQEIDTGQWQTSQITHRTIDNPNSLAPEGTVRDLARPIVVVDEHNRVIVLYRDNEGFNGVTIAYSESAARDDWQFIDLTTENLGKWEPTYDLERWERDGVLSVFYQPVGLGQTGSTVSVLEWDARGYFSSIAVVPEPTGFALCVLGCLGGGVQARSRRRAVRKIQKLEASNRGVDFVMRNL